MRKNAFFSFFFFSLSLSFSASDVTNSLINKKVLSFHSTHPLIFICFSKWERKKRQKSLSFTLSHTTPTVHWKRQESLWINTWGSVPSHERLIISVFSLLFSSSRLFGWSPLRFDYSKGMCSRSFNDWPFLIPPTPLILYLLFGLQMKNENFRWMVIYEKKKKHFPSGTWSRLPVVINC